MKIEKSTTDRSVAFLALPIGDCFIYDDKCYIKIDVSCSLPNAFNFESNEKDSFSGGTTVIPVNAKVVIE